MREIRTLGPWLRRFFDEYLVSERNLARNTRASYRDAIVLLLPFVSAKARKPIDRLRVTDLTAERVRQFLTHLETERDCSIATRNQRLAAIRCFARFLSSRDPAFLEWSASLRAIALKKGPSWRPASLTKDEMEAVLEVPDRTKHRGRVEHALLLFLYNTGARVSEAVRLTVGDVQLGHRRGRHALVTLHGKGGKTRQCPLWAETERVLAELVSGRADTEVVFHSRLGEPFTRYGVYRLVERSAAKVPDLAGKGVTPHMLRHTTARVLLRSGVDINTIRIWLGHVSLATTSIYLETDFEMTREALAFCDVDDPGTPRPLRENNGLLDYLTSL